MRSFAKVSSNYGKSATEKFPINGVCAKQRLDMLITGFFAETVEFEIFPVAGTGHQHDPLARLSLKMELRDQAEKLFTLL